MSFGDNPAEGIVQQNVDRPRARADLDRAKSLAAPVLMFATSYGQTLPLILVTKRSNPAVRLPNPVARGLAAVA
jgi:hypothetical protein